MNRKTSHGDLDAWRRLFDAAVGVRDLAPWTFASEGQLIGVVAGPQEDTVYLSVMGSLGQHHAVAAYQGSEGLNGFWRAQYAAGFSPDITDIVMQTPHLQAVIASRSELDEWDRGLVKAVGLNPRGSLAWPYFRSYRPGLHPWYLEPAEVPVLETALLQLLAVGERIGSIPMEGEPPETYLTRVRAEFNGRVEWREEQRPAPSRRTVIAGSVPQSLIDQVSALPMCSADLALDLILIPHGVQDRKGERPFFIHLLVAVEASTGYVLSQRTLTPVPHFEAMLRGLPENALQMLCSVGCRPRRALVLDGNCIEIAIPALMRAGIEVQACDEVPALSELREYMKGMT